MAVFNLYIHCTGKWCFKRGTIPLSLYNNRKLVNYFKGYLYKKSEDDLCVGTSK